jgi:hypothetical protein
MLLLGPFQTAAGISRSVDKSPFRLLFIIQCWALESSLSLPGCVRMSCCCCRFDLQLDEQTNILGLFLLYNFQVFDMYRARLMSVVDFSLCGWNQSFAVLKSCHPQQRRAQGNCLDGRPASRQAKGIMQVSLSRGLALVLPNLKFLAAAKNSFSEIPWTMVH